METPLSSTAMFITPKRPSTTPQPPNAPKKEVRIRCIRSLYIPLCLDGTDDREKPRDDSVERSEKSSDSVERNEKSGDTVEREECVE